MVGMVGGKTHALTRNGTILFGVECRVCPTTSKQEQQATTANDHSNSNHNSLYKSTLEGFAARNSFSFSSRR
jgi:hypothetical protein